MRVPSVLPGLDTVGALRNPADEAVCVDEGLLMRSLITPACLSSSFSFRKLRPLQTGVRGVRLRTKRPLQELEVHPRNFSPHETKV